jgi:hypothetical protein
MALVDPEYPYWYMAFTAQVSDDEVQNSTQTDVPRLRNNPLSPAERLNPLLTHTHSGIPACVHQRPLHRWSAHHLCCVPRTHAGSRWRSVQHLRAARYLNWIDCNLCYL